ncbi:MAG: polyprenyl synthetase family protein [Ruminococcaceae bacterium]|nr:polyprenyl synthetase family protein [Oscillospiraceae bacterium]
MDISLVKSRLEQYRSMTERRLDELTMPLPDCLYKSVYTALRYSLLDAGKRIRPALAMEFCRLCGGEAADALDFACAVEMIHTYSLIHDDLPCMDNDDLRRGKPSCHKAFDEATALLAGDALQALAAQTIAQCTALPAERRIMASGELFRLCGIDGMVGGQVIDLESEDKEIGINTLIKMVECKTCALIEAACVMGCAAAGASDTQIAAARRYANEVGLAFQIIDDILDVVGDEKTLGKPIASDADNNKSNYVTLLGLEQAKGVAAIHTDIAKESAAAAFGDEAAFLISFAEYLLERIY